ncbi:chondroitin sulfate synthase 2 [Ischnura elegans]|uniref:chondroitin sulfate synthase 2 n=1 Tax=Ischnura elegans TaxID=197161 RepID=UPI001ED89798|nr:chondroitin sulfate synthase 2 [Ischnura elegans]
MILSALTYCRQNTIFFVGLCVGISVSLIFTPFMEDECFFSVKNPKGVYSEHVAKRRSLSSDVDKDDFEPQINFAGKPKKALKTPQTLVRPRYYSTELGIREKLFVGVLTSKNNIYAYGVPINKTVAHIVDKIMFFTDAPGPVKLNVSMPGILGFADTRAILKPFHALKYVMDNLLDEFDYFYFVNDKAYIKARKLYETVGRISVSKDVHMGSPRPGGHSAYCSLDGGLLLSHSVMLQIRDGLDWCVKNAFSDSNDDNIGRCILHSSGIPCAQSAHGEEYHTLHLPDDTDIENDLENLVKLEKFHDALAIFPVPNSKVTYKLHAYFSRMECERNQREIARLKKLIDQESKTMMSDSTLAKQSPASLSAVWPVGSQPGSQSNSRFDILPWEYFTMSTIYPDSDFSSARQLNGAELEDIQYVINTTAQFAEEQYQGKLRFRRLVNGYRRFDPSRGMDYVVDFTFRDTSSGLELQKRFEVAKPLGATEIVPMPYVTENTRVTVLLPVGVESVDWTLDFIHRYSESAMSGVPGPGGWARSTYLLLVLLYDPLLPGKGTKDDIFGKIKAEALSVGSNLRAAPTGPVGGSGIAWVSLKSPTGGVRVPEFAIVDMAIKKLIPDSLVFYTRPNAVLHLDFLNRVRMNTIIGWQVFSPIPFAEYHPEVVYTGPDLVNRPVELEVNKSYGHFDSLDVDHLSFYAKDYLAARKKIEDVVPLARNDRDVARGHGTPTKDFSSVYSLFVKASPLHVLRGVEPSLRLWHPLSQVPGQSAVSSEKYGAKGNGMILPNCKPTLPVNIFSECLLHSDLSMGTRAQLGSLLLQYREHKSQNIQIV